MPTRQEMLDKINMKIARASHSDEGTGCFLPIERYDITWYARINKIEEKILRTIQRGKTYTPINEELRMLWNDRLYLENQSDECISYIYNILSHDK